MKEGNGILRMMTGRKPAHWGGGEAGSYLLDNKMGMQNGKMADFINVGEFFTGKEKQEDGEVQTLGQEKNREDKTMNNGLILKGTLGS